MSFRTRSYLGRAGPGCPEGVKELPPALGAGLLSGSHWHKLISKSISSLL